MESNEQLLTEVQDSKLEQILISGELADEHIIRSFVDDVVAYKGDGYIDIQFNVICGVNITVTNEAEADVYENTIYNTASNRYLRIDSSLWDEGAYTISFVNINDGRTVSGSFKL